MKKLITMFLIAFALKANAQTFPVNNLQVNGSSTLAGSLTVSGSSSFGLFLGGASSPVTFLAPGTSGFLLQSNGPGLSPSWINLTATFAPLNSPSFTGIPVAPTAPNGTNNTQIATTAFVTNGFVTPTTLAAYAPLASPALTGTPTSTTAAVGTNNAQIATTAYVANNKPCPSILDHGGDNTNTLDNSTAFHNTAISGPIGNSCVYFPPGIYKFTAAAAYTNTGPPSSIMVRGAGQDVTTLAFSGLTNGIVLGSNAPGSSMHIRDLTVTTDQNGGATGITLLQSSSLNQFFGSDIYHVSLRGSDNTGGGGSHYWTNGILIEGQDNVNVESVTAYGGAGGNGIGLICEGNGTQYAIYVNISKSVFNSMNTGIQYLSYCQGMTITQSNFQNDVVGFSIPAGQSGTLSQLQISDSQFATSSNAIAVQTNVGNAMIHDNDIFVHTGVSGIFITNTSGGGTIHGNSINTDGSGSAGASGIALGNGSSNFVIGNNQIAGLANCILYQAGATFNQNLGNNLSCTNAVVDNGSSNTKGVATN